MPWLRSPLTEMTGHWQSNQYREFGRRHRCANLELNAMECLEAYGYYRGERYCRDFIQDWDECNTMYKAVSVCLIIMMSLW